MDLEKKPTKQLGLDFPRTRAIFQLGHREELEQQFQLPTGGKYTQATAEKHSKVNFAIGAKM